MKEQFAMNTDKIYAEQLANEYAPKDTSKVAALRKLDAKAKLPATIFTYTFGIIAALIFGTGMCLAMGQIGSGTTGSFVLGIVIGIIGMIGMGVNYPIYKKLLANGKKKYAFEIMELGQGDQRTVSMQRGKPIFRKLLFPAKWVLPCCPPRCPLRHWSSSLCLSVRKIRWHMDLLFVGVFPCNMVRSSPRFSPKTPQNFS